MTYECVSITGAVASITEPVCADWTGDLNTGLRQLTNSYDKVNDYPVIRPQLYTVTIRGTANKNNLATDTATFTFELKDVCDPPATITRPSLNDQTFNIENDSKPTYDHEAFTVDPSQCGLTHSYSNTLLVNSDADTVIDAYDPATTTFTWDYPADDDGPIRPDL